MTTYDYCAAAGLPSELCRQRRQEAYSEAGPVDAGGGGVLSDLMAWRP